MSVARLLEAWSTNEREGRMRARDLETKEDAPSPHYQDASVFAGTCVKYVCMHSSIYRSIYLPTCLPTRLPTYLSTYLSIYPSLYLCAYVRRYKSIYPYARIRTWKLAISSVALRETSAKLGFRSTAAYLEQLRNRASLVTLIPVCVTAVILPTKRT